MASSRTTERSGRADWTLMTAIHHALRRGLDELITSTAGPAAARRRTLAASAGDRGESPQASVETTLPFRQEQASAGGQISQICSRDARPRAGLPAEQIGGYRVSSGARRKLRSVKGTGWVRTPDRRLGAAPGSDR